MPRLQWFDPGEARYEQESSRLVSKRAKKIGHALSPFIGRTVNAELLSEWDRLLTKVIPDATARAVFRDELRSLVGAHVTKDRCISMACALSGAYSDASAGRMVNVFAVDHEPVDCLARIEAVTFNESDPEKMLQFHLLICNSLFAGSKIINDIYFRSMDRWASLFNMKGRKSGIVIDSTKLFVGIEMIARLERYSGDVQLVGVTMNERLAERNYRLMRMRFRHLTPCPFGATFDCKDCAVGTNQCSAAVLNEQTAYTLERVTYEVEITDDY